MLNIRLITIYIIILVNQTIQLDIRNVSGISNSSEETNINNLALSTNQSNSFNHNNVSSNIKLGNNKLVNKPQPEKRGTDKKIIEINTNVEWKCPNISRNQNVECGCDLPHTLRCSGNLHGLELIANGLRKSRYTVSLLDCTLKNVTFLSDARIFENISLHGLVISSGEIKRVHRLAFAGIQTQLQALGLPNNALVNVPSTSLAQLPSLDRLDLSNNRIKLLQTSDFKALKNLTYLELSENQISLIEPRAFIELTKLVTLKLNGNRLGDYDSSLKAVELCVNLRELDIKANVIRGPLTNQTLAPLSRLELLNMDRNLLNSVESGALQGFPKLVTLSLRHNQIDVLQEHAFLGLSSLQVLDLGYNGIVAVSGASLQHLPHLVELDLTHNFLRALTSDLINPLPSLKELRLDGNDISMVAENALNNANELHSLSLQDNPLSCDCTLQSFAEWLIQTPRISSQDLLGAVCATPRHLEGAPLLQIPIESFKCETNSNYDEQTEDRQPLLEQLEAMSKQSNNLSHIKDSSDVILLKELRYTVDHMLILWWNINLKINEFTCDAVFVYKEENMHEILLDNSPIKCDNNVIDGENIVRVELQDITELVAGESYRFCLVLLHERNIQTNLIVGCSNITKLARYTDKYTDIVQMDKIAMQNDRATTTTTNLDYDSNDLQQFITKSNYSKIALSNKSGVNGAAPPPSPSADKNTIEIFNNFTTSKNFLPGLGFGIILTSLFILIFMATKFKNDRPPRSPVTTLYTATTSNNVNGIGHPIDMESRNRYVKLQATTCL